MPDRSILLNVGAGWHAHLDVLVLRLNGKESTSFWDTWQKTSSPQQDMSRINMKTL